MATFRMALNLPAIATANAAKEQKTPTDQRKEDVLVNMGKLMTDVAGGLRGGNSGTARPSFILSLDQNATAATGTMTATGSAADGVTVTIGSIVLTGKTGTPSGQAQFKVGVSADADGAAFAACVNAHTTLSLFLSAANASGVVTLTAIGNAIGLLGNAIKLASSDGTNMAVSGATLTGGAEDTGKQTYTF